ncbi:MAG TPA: histidinol-phosphatase [Candidatus Hydrogenedentes bacterium]|nr:histidinol-phosphatase [Candidatus Hydrogenedentota bacterium]
MTRPETRPCWRASLHGGHSAAYCDHARSSLRDLLDAAVARDMCLFGITEHAPRVEPGRLYDEERAMGWTIETLAALFAAYAREVESLRETYADRLIVLKGFESEVVPVTQWETLMLQWKREYGFDYVVGSVHYVAGHIIDYKEEHFLRAVEAAGGMEQAAVRYFRAVAEMAERLRPEVVGHFDLIRKQFPDDETLYTPATRRAALEALEAVRDAGCILDINTGGYRKGLGRPYPAAFIVRAAADMGIPVCPGDDSHAVEEVGYGLEAARAYLLAHGIREVTLLWPGGSGLERRKVPLA